MNVNRAAYKKLRLREFNKFDTERTLRENIYDLEQENIRIEALVLEMLEHKIPVDIILKWMRQLEDNVAEIVYITSLVQHDLTGYNFENATVLRKGGII